jgi:threonine-phosphate decarboxylase
MSELPMHGGQLRAIAEEFGVAQERLLDFSANINPDGPPESLRAALRAAVEDLSLLTSYPDLEERTLRTAVGAFVSLPVTCSVVANGFAPLLSAAIEALQVRRCLLPVPAFVEYRRVLEQGGVEVVPLPLREEAKFRYNVDAILAAAVSQRCDTVLLANPQNPTGVLLPAEAMRSLIERMAESGLRVLLDEAFIDYVPQASIVRLVESAMNLVVFRSVTKFFAVPGLRVAYALSNATWAEAMRRRIAPWAITILAARAVMRGFEDTAFAEATRARNVTRRTELDAALRGMGLRVSPGQANFLFFRVSGSDGEGLRERMIMRHGVVLRSCANYEGLDRSYYRVAVRTQEQNRRLMAALSSELKSAGRG